MTEEEVSQEAALSKVLQSLHRLRSYARQQSALQLKAAEVQVEAQVAVVEQVQDAIVRARSVIDHADAIALAEYGAFRLRQELVERVEIARLQQREKELEGVRVRHIGNVQDELVLQNVMESQAAALHEELRRGENRIMDEIALQRGRTG